MRIRKETRRWNWKAFFAIYGVFLLFYGSFYIGSYFSNSGNLFKPVFLVNIGLIPLIMAASLAYSFRKTTLLVNDYESIPDFKSVLQKHILNKNLLVLQETEQYIIFKPSNWFYRMFNSWGKTEYITVTWGTEITISGATHRIQQIDDSLRWNADFKR